jgi:protein gp37/ParB-like chromosome segregation protein Spo0J
MTRLGPYEVHLAADLFPLLEGPEFDELVQDIKSKGLRQPIVLTHDKATIVDGRNRYRACDVAGVDPVFDALPARYTEQMILDLIVSENIRRRHLNPGQLAMLAADLEPMYAAAIKVEEAARKREDIEAQRKGTSADRRKSQPSHAAGKAAGAAGAKTRSTERAKAVQKTAPDLADKVRSGRMALDAAEKQARARAKAQPNPDPKPKPNTVMLALHTHTGEEVAYPKPQSKPTFNETTGEGISWAGWSWNPVTGCLHGCDYCYARAIIHRYPEANPAGFTPLFHEERLGAPANTTIPAKHRDNPAYRRVFVCSMADLYGRWVPDDWIQQVHTSMLSALQWQYILLTKFPARYVGLDLPPAAWVGTSVDEQKRVRIAQDAFRQIDGTGIKKWLSLEPLLEPLEFDDLSMFDWVVIGAQTETNQPTGTVPAFRPEFEWVARIFMQAREAGCRIHIKPNVVNGRPGAAPTNEYPGGA